MAAPALGYLASEYAAKGHACLSLAVCGMLGAMGVPTGETISDETWEEICEQVSTGKLLTAVCRAPGMPSPRLVLFAVSANAERATSFGRARALGFEAMAEETVAIADGALPDALGEFDVQRDRMRMDARFKLLSKLDPARFGEAIQMRHANADGSNLENKSMAQELLALARGGATISAAVQVSTPDPMLEAMATKRITKD